MVRYGCLASVRMAELAVRSTAANLHQAEPFERSNDLSGLEYGERSHRPLHVDGLGSNELGLQLRLPVFEKHRDHLSKVLAQFLKCHTLGMGAWKAWHVADE